jgi:dolichyl-phosphate-mannose-protein mannosyltransferase
LNLGNVRFRVTVHPIVLSLPELKMNKSRLTSILILLAFVKFILPFILQNSFYQLHRDEYLYLAEGHHPAWGFMEVPPMMSILASITNLFGGGMFWVKLWPALFGAFTFFLVGRIVLLLGGKAFALILAWFPFVLDGYMRLFFLFHPNFLDVFFWTAMAYSIFRYIQNGRIKWIYFFGVSAGLGMMSKYSVAFFLASLLAGLLVTRHRKIFLNKHLWFSLAIALLIFLPNLIWQYNHRFPVITHMQKLQEQQLQFVDPVSFVISQFLMNLPCVYIWIAGLLFVMFNLQGRPYRVFAWAFLFVIALLIALRGKDYYALGAYPILFALGAYHLEQLTAVRLRWMRYVLGIFTILLGLFGLPLILPVARPEALAKYYAATGINKAGFFKWEDQQYHPLPQDFGDMIGWRELAEKTGSVYKQLPAAVQNKTMVYCRGYYTAGALNYYRKSAGLPEVYSDNASFLFWMPDKYDVSNLILVARNMPASDDIVFQQFEKVTVKDSVDIPLFRENRTKIILFEHGNDSLNSYIEKSVYRLKSEFMR